MTHRAPRRLRPAPLLDLMEAPTTAISRLESLLSWKLLRGSHKWPGPDGGTCILEAAIVVAGWPYCAVRKASDAPYDFSPVVSDYLLHLNDQLRDDERQQLMPFVTRLSGSAARADIERKREDLIVAETVRHLMAPMFDLVGRTEVAAKCRTVRPGDPYARRILSNMADEHRKRGCASWVTDTAWAVEFTVGCALLMAKAAGPEAGATRKAIIDRAIAIADDALRIGRRRAKPIATEAAALRLERASRLPPPEVATEKAC